MRKVTIKSYLAILLLPAALDITIAVSSAQAHNAFETLHQKLGPMTQRRLERTNSSATESTPLSEIYLSDGSDQRKSYPSRPASPPVHHEGGRIPRI